MEITTFWPEAQGQQGALSTNGRLIIAEGSGHYIHWEQPAVVIDAVRQVVEKEVAELGTADDARGIHRVSLWKTECLNKE